MRTHWLILLALLIAVVPVMAQEDDQLCESVVATAIQTAQSNCSGVGTDQICYGSGNVEAIPRYLTADFAFDDPGTMLDLVRVETVSTRPLNLSEESYGVAYGQLSLGMDNGSQPVTVMLLGNTFVANNVVAALQLDVTTNTLVNLQAQPSDLSERVGALVPGEAITATGRLGDSAEITDNTWIRVRTSIGTGWIPAFAITESFQLPSLQPVEPDAMVMSPMQEMTFVSGVNDRACANATDSGLLVQSPPQLVMLNVNQLDITFGPNSTVFLQSQSNATMDLYVVEGGIQISNGTATQTASAGQVLRVPVGLDGQINGDPVPPVAYLNGKVDPLQLATFALPRPVVVSPGTEPTTVASSEVVLPGDSVPLGAEMAPADGSGEVVEEVAALPGEEIAAMPEDTGTVEEVAVVPAEEVAAPPADTGASAASGSGFASSTFAQQIRARGSINIGVNGSLPTFSLEQDGVYSGFEIDLAQEIVARLFGSDVQIVWVNVSARQRPNVLVDGAVDLMIRNSEFMPDRIAWGDWTNTFYFIDGLRLMTRASEPINTYADMTGRSIGVQAGTDAQTVFDSLAAEGGFTVVPLQGTLVELLNALDGGQVDALAADWTSLEAIRATTADPSAYRVFGEPQTTLPWNVVVPPGQTSFRDEVDAALLEIINDGTWQLLYATWFGNNIPQGIALIFSPGASGGVTTVAAAPVEPTAAPPADTGGETTTQVEAAPTAEPQSSGLIPIEGDVPVSIFTAETQQRTVRLTPGRETFLLELIRNGEVVYDANYRFYESSGRWENEMSSFEYVEFSDTAGQEELGCNREPDIKGFFNGAQFEGRKGC